MALESHLFSVVKALEVVLLLKFAPTIRNGAVSAGVSVVP